MSPSDAVVGYLPRLGLQFDTVHGAVVSFKGRWVAFYHAAWGSMGATELRDVQAEFLTVDDNGDWSPITPTSAGVTGGKTPSSRIWWEAERAPAASGRLATSTTEVWAKTTGAADETYDLGAVRLKAGDNTIQRHTRDNVDIRLDAFELTLLYSR